MPGRLQKDNKGKTERIEIRLSTDLKQALSNYSDNNLETVMETTNRAIKQFVGFGEENPSKPCLSNEGELPKNDRLEIRVHPELKKMLKNTRNKIDVSKTGKSPNISSMVISAIMQYINYK